MATATVGTMPSEAGWHNVAYGNGIFVATSSKQTYYDPPGLTERIVPASLATSPDGVTWTLQAIPDDGVGWIGIAFGNGVFVMPRFTTVATPGGSNQVAVSPDGIFWTIGTLPATAQWESIAYGGGMFVAIAQGSDDFVASPDGVTWTAGHLDGWVSPGYQPSIAYDDIGHYWVAGTGGNGTNNDPTETLRTSPDGITWTASVIPEGVRVRSVTAGNGVLIAIGTNYAAWSDDGGATWNLSAPFPVDEPWNYYAAAFGNGVFVTVPLTFFGEDPPPPALYSFDNGKTWVAIPLAGGRWTGIGFGKDLFVALANTDGGLATIVVAEHYLRMTQRDDGLGTEGHPRLAGTGSNNPSSAQLGKPTRLGASSNVYV